MADVFHRIYTHAALDSLDTTGGRTVPVDDRDAAGVLDPGALRELDELLKKTVPERNATAWVVRRFGAFACVVTSYPDLILDAEKRSGVLNHARLLRAGASDPLFDVADLVASANDFGLDDLARAQPEERLAMYLDQLSGEQASVPERPVSIEELQLLPPEFLREFLIACLVGSERREAIRFLLPARESITSLAIAWAALPTGLQRSTSFAFAVADGCPIDVVFSTSSGTQAAKVGSELPAVVDRYLDLLFDSQSDALSLLRNSEIKSGTQFKEAVNGAMISGRNRMTKGKQQPPPRARGRDGGGSLDPEIVAELHRQYEAMQESLEDYVRQVYAQMESRQPPR